jgi:serine/threonine protein phosphatase 1
VLSRLTSLFRRRPASPPFDAPLAPKIPFYAVGDLHGRADLLETALERIAADRAAQGNAKAPIIFLGDYVDRGENSAAVLARLRALQGEDNSTICLMGNHEKMMLEFLDDPVSRGGRWLRNGGLQTLASYGVGGLSERAPAEDLMEASDALREALPEGTEAWLRALPTRWQSGNICCVHAAMDPELGPDLQSRSTLLWGHPEFFTHARQDGLWVIHGHTIVPEPEQAGGRIAIDTGAYATGRLTVAALSEGACRFI